jgi:hypothetical protein
MARSIYRRLSGRARSLGGYSQLWIAPDHILLLRSTGFRQDYLRFALADIQALVVAEMPSRLPLQAALGATAVLWMLAFMLVASAFAKGFFLVIGGIALALVIADVARGPRCRCFLHTAVSRELLAPIARMRTARKFLERIQPAIEAVQGSVVLDQVQELEDRSSSQSLDGPRAATLDRPPEIARQPGYLPETVFGVFLINAGLILASVLFRYPQVMNALPTTLFAEILLVIVALFRRGSRDSRRYIYFLMTVALVGIGWDAVLFAQSFGHWIASVAEAGQRGRPAPFVPLTSWTAFQRGHGIIAASWRTAAGLIGLAGSYFERPRFLGSRPSQPVTEPQAQ